MKYVAIVMFSGLMGLVIMFAVDEFKWAMRRCPRCGRHQGSDQCSETHFLEELARLRRRG